MPVHLGPGGASGLSGEDGGSIGDRVKVFDAQRILGSADAVSAMSSGQVLSSLLAS